MSSIESDRVRPHGFDDIQEFDNRLPNWWLWTFYLACIFSVFYWLHYHAFRTGDLPAAEYHREMEEAAVALAAQMAGMETTDAMLEKLAAEPAMVEKGKAVFLANCTQCHKADAGGNIGPNLTDKFWLHGNAPTAIFKTVTKGVVEKGMQSWEPVLGPVRCQQVVAYVLSIRDTNVAGGKEPQGEPVH